MRDPNIREATLDTYRKALANKCGDEVGGVLAKEEAYMSGIYLAQYPLGRCETSDDLKNNEERELVYRLKKTALSISAISTSTADTDTS